MMGEIFDQDPKKEKKTKKKSETALAEKDKNQDVAISTVLKENAELRQQMQEDIGEFTEGMTLPLERIKLVAGGAGLFEFPEGDHRKEFFAVILDSHPANAFWQSTDDDKPRCWSPDGKVPAPDVEEPVAAECKVCPYNQFGSAGEGRRGKACKNLRRMVLLMLDDSDEVPVGVPIRLTLPPTSLKYYAKYMSKLTARSISPLAVVTKIMADVDQVGEYKVTVVKFEKVKELTVADYMKMRELREFALRYRPQPIAKEEYANGSEPEIPEVPY